MIATYIQQLQVYATDGCPNISNHSTMKNNSTYIDNKVYCPVGCKEDSLVINTIHMCCVLF